MKILNIFKNQTYPFEVPALPYDYDALSENIDEETMKLHHDKHHNSYVTKLNSALENHKDLHNKTLTELLTSISNLPEDLQQKVINHGGGHANHTLFWEVMVSNGEGAPKDDLLKAIETAFGDFADFKEKFTEEASGVFGSGWAWLVVNEDSELEIVATKNQDSPLLNKQSPILGIDVWEHAYYLKYQNKRPDYIQAWWNVVNWTKVTEFYQEAIQ